MKLTIPTKNLKEACARLKTIAGRKTTLPILGNILFEAEGQQLRLTATDLDQQLTITLEAKIDRQGRATLPCGALFATLSKLSAAELALDIDAKHTAKITCGSQSAKLLGLPAEEFPNAMTIQHGSEILVTGEILGEWLRKTLPATSTDVTRFVMMGIHFTSRQGLLTVEAVDGRRVVIITTELASTLSGAILAADAARVLSELCGESEVALSFSDSFIGAQAANWRLVAKQIDGNFPNTLQVVPEISARKCRIDAPREALVAAIEFAEVFCGKDSPSVKIQSSPGQPLRVTAGNPQADGETSIEGHPRNSSHVLCANGRFLIDMLHCYDGDRVLFQMVDEFGPVVIEERGVLSMTMPMRVG